MPWNAGVLRSYTAETREHIAPGSASPLIRIVPTARVVPLTFVALQGVPTK